MQCGADKRRRVSDVWEVGKELQLSEVGAVVCCSVLQSVAVCRSVLQCVAVCCRVLWCCPGTRRRVFDVWEEGEARERFQVSAAVCCSVLQCVAVCCSVLQRGLDRKIL